MDSIPSRGVYGGSMKYKQNLTESNWLDYGNVFQKTEQVTFA